MSEYTYDNVIINPYKEGVESLVGKEVYFYDNPSLCLKAANEKSTVMTGILVEICKDSIKPFCVEQKDSIYEYPCIIEKKEEPKPEYVPFESMEEFVKKYEEVRDTVAFGSFEDSLFRCGMWLKDKVMDAFFMVTELWSYGVAVSGNMKTTEELENEYLTINEPTTWENLLRDYTFLDGSPCGVRTH